MSVETVQAYRTILRHLRKYPSHGPGSAPVRHLISQFKRHSEETDAKKVAVMRATAQSYATLLSSVTELSRLRALDTGERLDPRAKIRATASRVGLGVPNFSDEPQS